MKRFAFTLQPLYHLKQSLEKQERNTLGQLTARLHQLEAAEEALVAERARAGQEFSQRLTAGMTAADTGLHVVYDRAMGERITEQRAMVRQARADVEACRARLVEAMREVRMLERLRDRQYEEYLKLMQAEESAVINDFVTFTTRGTPSTVDDGSREA